MRRSLAVLALAAALALAAVPAAGAASRPARTGAELYAESCLSCHGAGGRGVSPGERVPGVLGIEGAGPPLRGVGERAADFYLRTGYMPLRSPYTQPRRGRSPFTDREIDALVRYVASLGPGPRAPTPRPGRGSLSEGLQLFTQHCAGCHQVVAEGGYLKGAVAPPLEEATSRQIAEAVRIGPYLMPRFTAREISDRQLDSIVRYVQYAKRPDDRGGWAIGHIGPVPEGLVAWLIAGTALVAGCLVVGKRLTR